MKQIVLLIATLAVFGCSSRQSSSLLDLGEEIQITAEEYANDLIIRNPLDIAVIEDEILLFMPQGENNAILMINKENGILDGCWGKHGNGPGEFTYPIYWGHDTAKQELYLYDLNYRCLRTYAYQACDDSLSFDLTKEIKMQSDIAIRPGAILGNHNIVASAFMFHNAPLLLMDEDLKPLQSFGRLPGQDESFTDMRTYVGGVGSYENQFAFGMEDLGYLAFYTLSDTTVHKEWEIYLEKPIYREKELDGKKLKQGFKDIEMTKNYIFCGYCGKLFMRDNPEFMTNNILVFNYEGQLVRNLKLDRKIGHIAVSEDEKTIYAVAFEPNISIVRYSLDNLLH